MCVCVCVCVRVCACVCARAHVCECGCVVCVVGWLVDWLALWLVGFVSIDVHYIDQHSPSLSAGSWELLSFKHHHQQSTLITSQILLKQTPNRFM